MSQSKLYAPKYRSRISNHEFKGWYSICSNDDKFIWYLFGHWCTSSLVQLFNRFCSTLIQKCNLLSFYIVIIQKPYPPFPYTTFSCRLYHPRLLWTCTSEHSQWTCTCFFCFQFYCCFYVCPFSIQSVRLIPSTLAPKFLYLRLTQLNHFSTDGNHQGAHFNKRGATQAANGFGWEAAFKGAGFNLVTVAEGSSALVFALRGKKLFLLHSLIWKCKPVSASSHHYRVIKLPFTHFVNGAWKWQRKGKHLTVKK